MAGKWWCLWHAINCSKRMATDLRSGGEFESNCTLSIICVSFNYGRLLLLDPLKSLLFYIV